MTVYQLVRIEREGADGADLTLIDPATPTEYHWLMLSPKETVEVVVTMLRTLEQPEREHAVALATAELHEFIGERYVATLRPSSIPPQ